MKLDDGEQETGRIVSVEMSVSSQHRLRPAHKPAPARHPS